MAGRLSSARFFGILRKRNGSNRAAVDRRLEGSCVEQLAILVSDASGFTRRAQEHGILQFLAVMTRCYDRLIPIIRRRRGVCVSHGADNILAVFKDPADAVAAAADMHRWLKRRNRGLPEPDRFNVCIGIDYGPVFRLSDGIFGDRVNVASKLGEDMAGKDETLVTREVADRVRGRFRCRYSRSVDLGGQRFELFTVRRQ